MRLVRPSTLRPENSPGLGGRGGVAVEGVADEPLLGEVPDERRACCSKLSRDSSRRLGARSRGRCAAPRADVLGLVAGAAEVAGGLLEVVRHEGAT
eukprot:6333144-Alexandrium_andersonii.AAC.1